MAETKLIQIIDKGDEKIAEMPNWNGKVVELSRTLCEHYSNKGLHEAGVYLLFCADENQESVYVGESEDVLQRIGQHLTSYSEGKEKYYWDKTIIIVGENLDKAHIRALEDLIVKAIKKSGSLKVLTKNTYSSTKLNEFDRCTVEAFLKNIRTILPYFGENILEPPIELSGKEIVILCARNGSDAKCIIKNDEFIVLKGSKVSKTEAKSFQKHNYKKLRDRLIAEEVIKEGEFTKDYAFSAPSPASAVVCGSPSDGKRDWKDEYGKTIGEYLTQN